MSALRQQKWIFACSLLCFFLSFFPAIGSAAEEDASSAGEPAAEETMCSPSEAAAAMRAHILSDYAAQDKREFIPMDPKELLQRSSRSFMQEFALYRYYRKSGKWADAQKHLEAFHEKRAAYERNFGLQRESEADYWRLHGELRFLQGADADARADFERAWTGYQRERFSSDYLTPEEIQHFDEVRARRIHRLEEYQRVLAMQPN